MTVKEWIVTLKPVQLYIIMFTTLTFFIIEMSASYITHSLTLLLHSYYMLCNIIALTGYLASTKKSSSDRQIRSTFGWARIDIVTMLVCCVLVASFCFSILIEAVQKLIHIDHLDAMHHPIPVMFIGFIGIILHILYYIFIGEYSLNQGIYLQFSKAGLILPRCLKLQAMHTDRDLRKCNSLILTKSKGIREMCRDFLCCIFVILDSLIVYLSNSSYSARFIDPIFAILSSISLFTFSYSYMKESGLILLQTIPNHINIQSLKREALEAFPGIVNIHDLHVWQLRNEHVISTVHIIFLDSTVYRNITDEVISFFAEIGVTQVTVQPEFHKKISNFNKLECLITCKDDSCKSSQCCTKRENDDFNNFVTC
ncbi:zinc transporter 1 [Leptopilina boulardi]|uniref:zinc transporter 1 n=1 Tax=Leptopilina boulardi TaxID=63433 RepID=UPI0021F66656|nr:zinc transporter 1 [Leptopilina boulardi]XP_051170575.1 zinc transporter 1 [Leptopilina boulardi]